MNYTILANLSTKYLMMCKVHTSFSRHELKLLSKCCVFKVRQYILCKNFSRNFGSGPISSQLRQIVHVQTIVA